MNDPNTRQDQEMHFTSLVDRRIFGWRKKCLYIVLVMLFSVVTVNLTLVCWLVTVLHLNTNGMSDMQSFGGGVQMSAKIFVEDQLITAGLKTREGQPMAVRSVANLTLRTVDRLGYSTSSIQLGGSALDINSHNFTVSGPRGRTLLNVNPDSVSLSTPSLSISGEGGAVLEGSLLTPIVSAGVRSNLVLESSMKDLHVVAPLGISVESRAGDIQVSSHRDVNLQTVDGAIKLESANVLFPGLRRLHHHKHSHRSDKIYQLCVCDNGQLYLGEADSFCNTEGANLELC